MKEQSEKQENKGQKKSMQGRVNLQYSTPVRKLF